MWTSAPDSACHVMRTVNVTTAAEPHGGVGGGGGGGEESSGAVRSIRAAQAGLRVAAQSCPRGTDGWPLL